MKIVEFRCRKKFSENVTSISISNGVYRVSHSKKFVFWFVILAVVSFFTLSAFGMGQKPKTFPVQMKINFGPADKPSYDAQLYVENGTTPKEAVSQVFPILSGKACCSFREVVEIGGVHVDPEKKLWWICLLNGSKNVSPQKKQLKEGDVVEWKYIQDSKDKLPVKPRSSP